MTEMKQARGSDPYSTNCPSFDIIPSKQFVTGLLYWGRGKMLPMNDSPSSDTFNYTERKKRLVKGETPKQLSAGLNHTLVLILVQN